jgi:cytochrome P450 family 6
MQGSRERDIEVREFMAKFTTDVIGSCAFGLQFHSMTEDSSDFRKMGKKVMEPSKMASLSRMLRCFFPPLFRILNLRTFPKEVNDFFISVVADTLRYREINNIHREDFMDALSEIRGTRLADSDVTRKGEISTINIFSLKKNSPQFSISYEMKLLLNLNRRHR